MNTIEHTRLLIQNIENNISSDFSTGFLTKSGAVSHTQLYRDFYSLTGHSVKEYIRKRKLSNALALIKVSAFSLAQIAYECGYSSQQALCRSVKCAVNMTPLEYKSSNEYYFFPPYNNRAENQINISQETIPQTVCLKYCDSRLYGIENRAINNFLSFVPEFKGRIFGKNGKQDGTRFCYELYITDIDYIERIPDDFTISHKKSSLTAAFAMVTIKNTAESINKAWNYLYYNWLCNSMFECSDEHYFEEYIIKNGNPEKLKLYLPIHKRNDYTKITLEQCPEMRFLVSKARGYNAEQISSKTVIDFLSEHYPYIIKTVKDFYIKNNINSCSSGVKINLELNIPDNEIIENLYFNEGLYLILHSSVMGEYEKYCDMILSFADNNGIAADIKNIFAVYDVKESYDNPKIKMYCKVSHIK